MVHRSNKGCPENPLNMANQNCNGTEERMKHKSSYLSSMLNYLYNVETDVLVEGEEDDHGQSDVIPRPMD